MNTITAFGKFLDQPVLVKRFSRVVSPLVTLGAGGILASSVYNSPKEDRKTRLIQNGLTMFGAVASSLLAPRIISKIFKTAPKMVKMSELKANNRKLVDEFVSNNKLSAKSEQTLKKAKDGILHVSDIKQLSEEMNSKEGREFMNNLIPEPENISSKEIFSEIGRLSIFGLIPVLGGIAGGIVGDRLTDSEYKKKIPNKVKEGAYQYLANIFLCNIGAGAALGILEKMNVRSKSARAAGMVSGIAITGVIGGSAIANFIGRHVIDKCFKTSTPDKQTRTPEPLDICLHSDDIATVAVMSGLKWIEPALPVLYSVSGYRAGIGYRGGKNKKEEQNKLKTIV